MGSNMKLTHFTSAAAVVAMLSACGGGDTESSSSSANNSNGQSSSQQSSTSVPTSSSTASSSSTAIGSVDVFTDLPDEYFISEDGERLERGGSFIPKFYDESVIETIYIDFPQANYQQQLTDNYESKTPIQATVRYKDKVFENAGVRYRGMTSYLFAGPKKSFKVILDWQEEGADINGYNDLKLNNAYGDPSNMREIIYSNLIRRNIPSAHANFMQVVVNGENQGVFANVQQLNKDHVKEWFFDNDATRWRAEAPNSGGGFGGGFGGGGFGGGGSPFGAGLSSLNDLGANGADYEDAYTLKGADILDPWQDLANAAHNLGVMSTQAILEDLGQYLDIDEALWMVASENLFVDDDSYIYKGGMDYYVYFDVFTQRILPIEYDGNSVLEARNANAWSPFYNVDNQNFPLLNILLNIPELRQRYLAHYRTLLEEAFDHKEVEEKIDNYVELISPIVQQPASVAEYNHNEFLAGVEELKETFDLRRSYVSNHSEVNVSGLTIANVVDSVNGVPSVRPTDSQSVLVSADIGGSKPVRAVNLYYGTGLAGRFDKVSMQNAGNSQYQASIPAQGRGEYVRYYIEAIADDSAGTASYMPKGAEHDVFIYQVQAANYVSSPVVINEIMPANDSTATDEQGEYGDWIELYNNSNQMVDLSGYYLTDEDIRLDRWAFPAGTVINANSTLIIWADDKEDLTTGLHTNFKLSASGENLYLITPNLEIADHVQFEDAQDDVSYARSPNGTGEFRWQSQPSFDAANN